MTATSTSPSSSILEIYSPSLIQSYPDTLRFLQSLNKKLKTDGVLAPTSSSIDHVRTLYNALGRPLDDIPVVHVGGTNGKGSVCYKIASALTVKGYKTGLFVSPHLMSYRERAQVDHQLISKEDVVRHLTTLVQLCASYSLPATEFELSFLLAALHFQVQKCDVVVLEVGCGGRYDATNVVNNTTLAILTSVALDHTAILGNTVEEIAKVKAGIFRNAKPVLVGPGVPFKIVEEEATKCGAVLYQLPTFLSSKGIVMEPDQINYLLSLEAVRLLRKILPPRSNCLDENDEDGPEREQVLAALRQLPPCRWQQILYQHPSYGVDIEVILDVAHNPAALEALLHRLDGYLPAGLADKTGITSNSKDDENHNNDREAIVHVVYAASRTKDMRSCLHLLADHLPLSSIHLTQSTNWRAVSAQWLRRIFEEETGKQLPETEDEDASKMLTRVLDTAAKEKISYESIEAEGRKRKRKVVVVICGTGCIMPIARRLVGIHEPSDEEDLANDAQQPKIEARVV
eukprot:gene7974-8795_t